jgi:lipid II:glycine glycyltransferase (peptidoglycan interpeptide bridge formation enzyme)
MREIFAASETAMTTIRPCLSEEDYAAWDRFLFDFPGAHYFQTYGWLKSYEPMGFTPHVLIYEVDGEICGGVAFLDLKIPLLPWRIFIIPHGPLPADPDAPSWIPLMKHLDDICKNGKGIYAQLYPHEFTDSAILLSRLEEWGFRHSSMFNSHRFSSTPVTIDLTGKTQEDILLSFRPRTRQYVRKSLASDLVMRTKVDQLIFDQIYDLFSKNAKLMGYKTRPYSSMLSAWRWFAPKGGASLIQAWKSETLVGAILLLFTGRTAFYLAGAFHREFSEDRPAEFLHWHGILEALNRQLHAYDLVNTVSTGVEQFKRGFRPIERTWQGPRTKLYHPLLAQMTSRCDFLLRPVIRSLARYWASR